VPSRFCSECGAPVPLGIEFCRSCGAFPQGRGSTTEDSALNAAGRSLHGLPRLVCPKCGAEVPDGWPAHGFDRCVECGTPLGRLALTDAIAEVGHQVGPVMTLGTGLIGAGLAFLVALLAYGSPVFTALQGPSVPLWALGEAGIGLGLFTGGGIVCAVAGWMCRRELRQRGIDSPTARNAAEAFFPRYAATRLIRAGRLEPAEPVLPHPAVPGYWRSPVGLREAAHPFGSASSESATRSAPMWNSVR
jgi:ribosomal protein L40E